MGESVILQVTPEALRGAADEVRKAVAQLTRDLDEAKSLVDRGRYSWLGPAGDKYRKSFGARRTEAQELLDRLAKYPSDLLSMAQIYDQAETANTQAAGKLDADIIE